MALHPITLRIEPAQFVAIMGPSGAGKSTLIRTINGLESATSGDIFLAGEALPYSIKERSKATLKKIQLYIYKT